MSGYDAGPNPQGATGGHDLTAGQAVRLVLLSDDSRISRAIEGLLALSSSPALHCQCIGSQHFSPDSISGASLVLVDSQFGELAPANIVALARQAQRQPAPAIAILVDDHALAATLPELVAAIKQGADSLLPRSELSLKHILQLLQRNTPGQAPAMVPGFDTPANAMAAMPATQHPAAAIPSAPTAEPQPGTPHPFAVHQLTIDLENTRVHISQNPHSALSDQVDGLLTLQQWLAMLDASAAGAFEQLISQARSRQALPATMRAYLRLGEAGEHAVEIGEIQSKVDSADRVIGLSAQLTLGARPLDAETDSLYPQTMDGLQGFDNLTDGSHHSMVDRIWVDITRSLPVMCLLLDENARIVKAVGNESLAEGHFSNAFPGQALTDLLGHEPQENYIELIHRTLNTGKSHQQTLAIQHGQSSTWLDTHLTRLRGGLGLNREVVWTAIDITQSRQAYQELLKNHESLTDMLNDAPILFCQKDRSGRYQRVNRFFCEAFNVRAELIAGRLDSEIFAEDAAERMHQSEEQLIHDGASVSYCQQFMINGVDSQVVWHKFAINNLSANRVESIAAFGYVSQTVDQQLAATASASTEASSIASLPADDGEPTLAMSGAIGLDFRAMIKTVEDYAKITRVQGERNRDRRFIEYLDQLIGASQAAREQIVDDKSADEPEPTGEDSQRRVIELAPLVKQIVAKFEPELPPSLDFRTDIDTTTGFALLAAAPFKKMVKQLLVSARDSAANAAQAAADNSILLSLRSQRYRRRSCASCGETLTGNYIALSVQTASGDLTADDLQRLIQAAGEQQAGNKTPDNIIALAHASDGHVIVEQQRGSVLLQLVFEQVDEPVDPDDSDATTESHSLSSL